jgi:hypothetical protein
LPNREPYSSITETHRQEQQCKSCFPLCRCFSISGPAHLQTAQHLFAWIISSRATFCSELSALCSFNETSFKPRAGSSTRLRVEAHWPQSQKCTVSRWGFSSNGAEPSSLAAIEIETTSNWKSLPSEKEYSGRLQCSFTQRASILASDGTDLTGKSLTFQYSRHCISAFFLS